MVLVALAFVLYVRWSGRMEAYCYEKAIEVIGGEDNWSKKLVQESEPKQYPHLEMITQGLNEEVKCEKDPETIKKFKGWF